MMNIPLFFLLAGGGLLLTILIWKTSKKTTKETHDTFTLGFIKLFGISISIIAVLFLFRLIMIAATGVISHAYEQVIFGVLCALIPFLVFLILRIKKIHKILGW